MPATRLDALIAGRENCIAIEIHKKTLCDAILQADMRALLFDRSRRRKIRAAVPADFTVTKVTPGCHRPRYYGGHDPFMAKLPGGGGSGRYAIVLATLIVHLVTSWWSASAALH